MPPLNITEGVRKRLNQLSLYKAAGPDRISPIVLEELADVISPVVTRIFRASLSQQNPRCLERHTREPVFKKGEQHKVINYCPISWTCILYKQVKHILASNVMAYLNSNNLLCDKQNGFCSKRSCHVQMRITSNQTIRTCTLGYRTGSIQVLGSRSVSKGAHSNGLILR